jgi:hypothetical protein
VDVRKVSSERSCGTGMIRVPTLSALSCVSLLQHHQHCASSNAFITTALLSIISSILGRITFIQLLIDSAHDVPSASLLPPPLMRSHKLLLRCHNIMQRSELWKNMSWYTPSRIAGTQLCSSVYCLPPTGAVRLERAVVVSTAWTTLRPTVGALHVLPQQYFG